jgi:DNA-binding SARP family transcriptional activator
MAMQLVTFGGLRVVGGTGEFEPLLRQHSRAALFICLAVERRISRESLTTIFWPESDAEGARHALRQGVYHLRKAVGADWIQSHAHELVMSDEVRSDADEFTSALQRGDLESAVRIYQGPFLDGVHLVDLQSWEGWVDTRRARYERAFRKACRELLEAKRAAGDMHGAISTAELWTAREPMEPEAQHRLMEALAAAGQQTEALRHFDAYMRMLAREGLDAPQETLALAERLRMQPAPLPTLRAPAAPPMVSPASRAGHHPRHHAGAGCDRSFRATAAAATMADRGRCGRTRHDLGAMGNAMAGRHAAIAARHDHRGRRAPIHRAWGRGPSLPG